MPYLIKTFGYFDIAILITKLNYRTLKAIDFLLKRTTIQKIYFIDKKDKNSNEDHLFNDLMNIYKNHKIPIKFLEDVNIDKIISAINTNKL